MAEIHLDEDDIREIVDWSINAGAAVILMLTEDAEDDDPAEVLDAIRNGLSIVLDNLPDVLDDAALNVAETSVMKRDEEEELAMKFREQLDDL